MIQINELTLTPDGKHLVVDVQITESEYYKDVYLSNIYVDTQKTFQIDGPSYKPLFQESYTGQKRVRAVFDTDSISDNLFFVYILAEGDPAEGAPCGMYKKLILGVTYNREPIYKASMKFLKDLNSCTPPQQLINFILRYKAFQLALKAGNYTKAIEYWNEFFKGVKPQNLPHNCGCHG